jgi:hypothetical protein
MKTLLKILLISSSLYACKNSAGDGAMDSKDSNNIAMPPDSVLRNDNDDRGNGSSSSSEDPGDAEKETTRQITLNLLSSKYEINMLRSEVSDSLTKSGLAPERRSLFAKTIRQLEASSDVVNKQLEQILVSDLQSSREKLSGIVKKMKGSEKELGTMIARLDKICDYMQFTCSLIQSVLPVPSTPTAAKNTK